MQQVSVLHGIEDIRIEQRPIPAPEPADVLVQVEAVGVCGSDVHYYRHGRAGDFIVEEPLILGHEVSGTIVAVGSDVDPTRVGERVAVEPQRPCHHCEECLSGRYNLCPNMRFYATPPVDGAFAEYITIESVFAHALPDAVSFEAGALLEPLSVAIAAARKANITPGGSVLITGAGPIGIICAQVARAFGATRIIVSDLVGTRRDRARAFGATDTVDPAAVSTSALPPVDVYLDASGSERAVADGIRAVKPAGRAVLIGIGNPDMLLPVSHLQDREVTVTGVFRYTNTWPLAIQLVTTGQVNLDAMVTHRYGLAEVPAALESDTDPDSLKSVVYLAQASTSRSR